MRAALVSAAFFMVAGCAGPDAFGGSRQAVEAWAQPRGFGRLALGTPDLPLYGLKRGEGGDVLHVYIEGDGAPWITPYHPPRDPTPLQPVALALAAADDAAAVVYLGRPCQYQEEQPVASCPEKYWTSHRFAPEVVASYQHALDAFPGKRFRLFGYSGGGVLALLLAGLRSDVAEVVTIAAPISVADWTAWHRVSPLQGSLDPATQSHPLPPALHLVGTKDDIVPARVVEPFARQSGGRVRHVAGFDHVCCWSRDWQKLLGERQ